MNIRKINRMPEKKNYYLVDACFLANKYLDYRNAQGVEKSRILDCKAWWNEIDKQIESRKARVYIPSIYIAETFKVFAKKYYIENEKIIKTANQYYGIREKFIKDISVGPKELKGSKRHIKYHDLPIDRDMIISVDRCYEAFMKSGGKGACKTVNDLMIVAAAKYLIDYFDIPKDCLFIITIDEKLQTGISKISEIPKAHNPVKFKAEKVFM